MSISPELRNTRAILVSAHLDPVVTMEFVSQREGIFCGAAAALYRLQFCKQRTLQVWALDEGAALHTGEVAFRVRGHYLDYGTQELALTGFLAAESGWATAARALAAAAEPVPVLVSPARSIYPDLAAPLQHAAGVGGCLAADSFWGGGILSQPLTLLLGDTVRAAQALDGELPPDVPRLARVGTFHDQVAEAVRVALALGNKLAGVILQVELEGSAALDLLNQTREQLDLAGLPRVKLFVSGAVTVEFIGALKRASAPVDGYFVEETLALASPLPFAAELKESDGIPLGRRGITPGTTPNPRLGKFELE